MVASPSHDNHNKQPHAHFKGPDDVTIRSAWSTTNQSIVPPSLVRRQKTMSPEDVEEALRNCDKVLKDEAIRKLQGKTSALKQVRTTPILKVSSNDNSDVKDEAVAKTPGSPSARKHHHRSQITSILKVSSKDKKTKKNSSAPRGKSKTSADDFDIDSELFRPTRDRSSLEGFRKTRSAWDITETRNSVTSVFGIAPARRQKTLDEADLRDAANITALAYTEINDKTKKTRGEAKAGNARW